MTVLSLVLAVSAASLYLVHSRSRLAQLDEELARAGSLVAGLVTPELEEGSDLAEAARGALEDIQMPGRFLAVFDADGTLLSGRWEDLPRITAGALGPRGEATMSITTPQGEFRLYRSRHLHIETIYQVGAAESLAPVGRELASLRRALLGSVLFALLLALNGGWAIARAALRPVEMMAAQARRITDRTPGDRLTSAHPEDELGQLAQAFNDVLGRLERALSQQRQFMADASHELRTPVSIARTAIDVTLSREGRLEEEYRDSLGVVREQMRRLSRIVEDLFTLARADAAGLPLEMRPLYIDELVADCVKETRLLAPSGVTLESRAPADLELVGDERLLRQMLINLLKNAVHHTAAGGFVRVNLVSQENAVEIEVTDSGAGIPEAERERIFERFVQLDASRHGEGSGLGLPIARAIAVAHGGSLVLARSDASGSTFVVRLPSGRAAPLMTLRDDQT